MNVFDTSGISPAKKGLLPQPAAPPPTAMITTLDPERLITMLGPDA
ncbi:hypothetical protein [Streptomyces resistomycificus]|nr:hypothetical protein [Streptomyces resistomycificus]